MTKVEWFLEFARKDLGGLPVKDIKPIEVLDVLRKVEKRGRFDTAKRLRSTIGAVFRYAIATVRAENDPTVSLRGALTTAATKSRAAITEPTRLGGLLRAIKGFDGQPTTRIALSLMALLFPRPGELRSACWSEFDLDKAIWTVPAARMKMRRIHKVPLPPQAVIQLKGLQLLTSPAPEGGLNSALLFPSLRAHDKPMSDNTMNAALRRMGYLQEEVSPHGFRATASTLLNESGLWNPDAIERQLAHVEGNSVRRTYARSEHWDERVRMMIWWANHLDELRVKIGHKTAGGALTLT